MLRSSAFFLLISLFLWFLPLGAFIKPAQEKTACGGQRAFHMCSMMSGKVNTERPQKISFTNASGFNETGKVKGSSSGDDFLPDEIKKFLEEPVSRHTEDVSQLILRIFPRPIFHPPSAALF